MTISLTAILIFLAGFVTGIAVTLFIGYIVDRIDRHNHMTNEQVGNLALEVYLKMKEEQKHDSQPPDKHS